MTRNERYLILIICRLRGTAYDGWGRLNALMTKKETRRTALEKDEIDGMLIEINMLDHGANMPHPNDVTLKPVRKFDKAFRKHMLKVEKFLKMRGEI